MSKPTANVRGYDSLFVERVKLADSGLPGVQLGRLCVQHNIPVGWVATRMNVSRLTVYRWFTGTPPRPARLAQIERLLTQLRKRLK